MVDVFHYLGSRARVGGWVVGSGDCIGGGAKNKWGVDDGASEAVAAGEMVVVKESARQWGSRRGRLGCASLHCLTTLRLPRHAHLTNSQSVVRMSALNHESGISGGMHSCVQGVL